MRMPASITSLFLILCLTSFGGNSAHRPHRQPQQPPAAQSYDICIYGGTASGVIAAYTAARMHRNVLLIEPGQHLGGLSSGGLGYTDIGNKYAIKGLSLDFYRRIGRHYGRFEQWIFEPHVAEDIFKGYIKRGNVKVLYGHRITKATKEKNTITHITVKESNANENENASAAKTPSLIIKSKMFIDCSYEGDLMARAGVSYAVGREANSEFNETYNGVQLMDHHQFPDSVNPYRTPADPSSGLLWGISADPLAPAGTGDKKVQAYNYRICLTDDPANRLPIEKPDNYDPSKYELLIRYLARRPAKDLWGFLKFDLLPNHKTDINNNGPFSTDMIGMSYDYPEADYATRARIAKAHTDYCQGLLYFIGHDPRMPAGLRDQMLKWGYPKDEYTDNAHWTPQIYVREARRMKGSYIMTQANCQGRATAKDGVGLAAYTMDSHNCQRIVVNGMVKNEGNVEIGGFPPYPISYLALVPKQQECTNLLVPVCLSATHIAYGSIRMEPVFMQLGQSSAIAAANAIDLHIPVQQVKASYINKLLQNNPLADGSTPEILVDNDDSSHIAVSGDWQRQTHDSYGFSRLADEHTDAHPRYVRFSPDIPAAGDYQLYIYVPATAHPSTYTMITASVNAKQTLFSLPTGKLTVQGQTSGEWLKAGELTLPKGRGSYIEISNRNADGTVIADAILLVPKRNIP